MFSNNEPAPSEANLVHQLADDLLARCLENEGMLVADDRLT